MYSVFNFNVISWGTREVVQQPADPEGQPVNPPGADSEEVKAIQAELEKDQVESEGNASEKSLLGHYLAKMSFDRFKGIKETVGKMESKVHDLEALFEEKGFKLPDIQEETVLKEPAVTTENVQARRKRTTTFRDDDELNPLWVKDDELGAGPRDFLNEREIRFWKELVEKYLKPLPKDAEAEKRVSEGLRHLRNKIAFIFLLVNAMWITVTVLLQANKAALSINWPFGARGPDISYSGGAHKTVVLTYEYFVLEPLGLIFILFFAKILILQTIGMLIHRTMTLGHIVATTELGVSKAFRKMFKRK